MMFSLSLLITACEDYEDINKSTTGATDKELEAGGLIYGTQLTEMQKCVIRIGSPNETTTPGNDLAVTDVMSSGQYIGYFGMNNNWKMATEATWDFVNNRMHYAFEQLYMKVYQPWVKIYQMIGKDEDPEKKEIMAMFDIIKITGWLRATDCFGPIVYTNAGNGDIAPALDKQEDVYKNMLKDLADCAEILNKTTTKVLAKYDLIYNGDAAKWAKLANSLMLRMAVRVHFINEDLAKEYIAKALDPQNGGIIETIADEAKIADSSKHPLLNSLIATIDYKENRMGATAWTYLMGYGDPRIEKYYTKGVYNNTESYLCVAPGNTEGKMEGDNKAEFASCPKVENKDPLYWFRASETFFLRAEAALYNLTSGNVKNMYESGIRMSMEEWGITGAAIDNYLSSNATPEVLYGYNYHYAGSNKYYGFDIAGNNVSPQWNEYATPEKKLQQIITQKYLAHLS